MDGQDIQQWVAWLLDRYSDAYASNQYRALQQFFRWLAAEDEVPDPMTGLRPPKVTGKLVPVFTGEELARIGQACAGRAFAQRRDVAIIAVFLATGTRLSELAGIRYDRMTRAASDIDLWQREIRIRGKGGKPRIVRGDIRGQIGTFLSTRRARISPAQAGLPVYRGEHRRVPGLRREEVAVLAGISTEYYTRFERGNATGVSDSVIDGIAHALQLDDAERAHLLDLIRTAGRPRRQPAPQHVRPAVQRIIDSMPGTPALVLNGRLDILTANTLGYALYAPVCADPARPANNARFLFLDPHATRFFRDWDKVASDTVAMLRAEAGRDPYDRGLPDLIGELSTRSDQFRVRWAAHNVRIHTTGVKLIHHPVVGDLDLPFESFPIPAEPSQSLLTYTTEPGSPAHDALSLLASWAASPAHDSQASLYGNDQQAPRQDPGHGTRSGSASRPGET